MLVRSLYIFAYFWIIGVILFVILEPLYSEIKVITFRIRKNTSLMSRYQEKKKNKRKFRSYPLLKRIATCINL